MLARENGTVKWFNNSKGYGFIQRDGDGDVFVHYSDIRGSGFRSLFDGQRVEFTVVEDIKGLKAHDVSILDWQQAVTGALFNTGKQIVIADYWVNNINRGNDSIGFPGE